MRADNESGSIVKAGSAANRIFGDIRILRGNTDVTDRYDISTKEGTLKILAKPAVSGGSGDSSGSSGQDSSSGVASTGNASPAIGKTPSSPVVPLPEIPSVPALPDISEDGEEGGHSGSGSEPLPALPEGSVHWLNIGREGSCTMPCF